MSHTVGTLLHFECIQVFHPEFLFCLIHRQMNHICVFLFLFSCVCRSQLTLSRLSHLSPRSATIIICMWPQFIPTWNLSISTTFKCHAFSADQFPSHFLHIVFNILTKKTIKPMSSGIIVFRVPFIFQLYCCFSFWWHLYNRQNGKLSSMCLVSHFICL